MRHAVLVPFCRFVVMKNYFLVSILLVFGVARLSAAEKFADTNAVVISPELIDVLAGEARTNHPALRAADARADVVKFQVFKSELVISRYAPKCEYQEKTTGARQSQLELNKKLELSGAEHEQLARHCRHFPDAIFRPSLAGTYLACSVLICGVCSPIFPE